MADIMPKAQYEFVTKVKNDMLINTNMTEDEAWDFGFRCWQMGYAKVEKKTNADRIRSMTDEELADVTMQHDVELGEYVCSDGKFYAEYLYEEALKHEIEWLKSPTTD